MIYFAVGTCYLIYGIEIYGNTDMTHLNRLMKVNCRIYERVLGMQEEAVTCLDRYDLIS